MLGGRLTSLNLERFSRVDVLEIGNHCPRLQYLRLSCIGSYVPVFDLNQVMFTKLEELELLNTRGAHFYSKALLQLLSFATNLRHVKFQFVDTLNDEVWRELMVVNPMLRLETLTMDQCHSVSAFTLEDLVTRDNNLTNLAVWSCRFITETDRDALLATIRHNNYDIHFSWYAFTGEEAPMGLDDADMESDDDDSFEDYDVEEEEENEHEFLNYWNNPPLPGRALGW